MLIESRLQGQKSLGHMILLARPAKFESSPGASMISHIPFVNVMRTQNEPRLSIQQWVNLNQL